GVGNALSVLLCPPAVHPLRPGLEREPLVVHDERALGVEEGRVEVARSRVGGRESLGGRRLAVGGRRGGRGTGRGALRRLRGRVAPKPREAEGDNNHDRKRYGPSSRVCAETMEWAALSHGFSPFRTEVPEYSVDEWTQAVVNGS